MSRTVITILIALAAFPSTALAQTGVHVDPESPAGKEYAIPLEQARREAGGTDGGAARPGAQAPLFGQGIGDSSTSAGSAGGDPSAAGRGDAGQAGAGAGGSPAAAPETSKSAAVAAAVGGGSSTALTAAIIGAVLLAAALAGVALRRVLRT